MNTILIRHLDQAYTIQAERLGYLEGDGTRITAQVPDNDNYKIDEYEMIVNNFVWQIIKKALACAKEWEYWDSQNHWINQQNRPHPKWQRGIEKELEMLK